MNPIYSHNVLDFGLDVLPSALSAKGMPTVRHAQQLFLCAIAHADAADGSGCPAHFLSTPLQYLQFVAGNILANTCLIVAYLLPSRITLSIRC